MEEFCARAYDKGSSILARDGVSVGEQLSGVSKDHTAFSWRVQQRRSSCTAWSWRWRHYN